MIYRLLCLTFMLALSHSILPLAQAHAATFAPEDSAEELLNFDEISDSEETPVPESLKIIGKGVQNRATKEVIALACAGETIAGSNEPSCKTLRYVKITPATQEAKWIGQPITLSLDQEPTLKDFQKAVVKLNEAFELYRKEHNISKRLTITSFVAMAVLGVGFVYCVMSGHFPTDGQILLAGLGVPAIIAATTQSPFLAKSGSISSGMASQNGWNWSVHPHKVSAKTFHWLEQFFDEDHSEAFR